MGETQKIESIQSFLGDMYARWTLDCLVEIAHAISVDYFSAPEFYRGDNPQDPPEDIVDLWLSYGSVKNFPGKAQRRVLAAAIFGESDGYPSAAATYDDSFHQNREALFKACIAAQTAGNSLENRPALDDNVRRVLPTFQSYLGGFSGKAARLAYNQIRTVSETSFNILRSDTISSRFIGIHDSISTEWPLTGIDTSGDMLIAESSSKLKIDGIDMPGFAVLRAMAAAGHEALDVIVQPTPTDLTDLISKTFSWAKFIESYSRSSSHSSSHSSSSIHCSNLPYYAKSK